jgi:hypothetical protein
MTRVIGYSRTMRRDQEMVKNGQKMPKIFREGETHFPNMYQGFFHVQRVSLR